MVSMCVKQNEPEVWNILIRPFQGDLRTFLCVTSSLLSSHLTRLLDEGSVQMLKCADTSLWRDFNHDVNNNN